MQESPDWRKCPLVEFNPKVQSGAPVVLGTRLTVQAIVDNFDYGLTVPEIAGQFEIPRDVVEQILAFAAGYRVAHTT